MQGPVPSLMCCVHVWITRNGQQSLIAKRRINLRRDKLALARTIGLPLDQAFHLTDKVPYTALNDVDPQAAFEQALKSRKDLQAAAETVNAAVAEQKSAKGSRSIRLPSRMAIMALSAPLPATIARYVYRDRRGDAA